MNYTTFPRYILLLLCLVPYMLVGQARPDAKLKKVSLQLKWKHQYQFAGYYAAIAQGFYHDEGLTVRLIEADDLHQPHEMVLDGKAEFGISTSDVVLQRAAGKPLVVVAPIFQHSAQVLLVRAEAGIDSLPELLGRRIMVENYSADMVSYLAEQGLPITQCQNIPHVYSITPFVKGEIDAMSAYSTTEPYALQELGVPFKIFRPIDGGIDFYGDVLFCNEELIRKEPELVKSFLRATLKGWNYAFQHEREVVGLVANTYDSVRSRRELHFEAQEMRKLIQPNVVEIGYSNPKRWQAIADVYAQRGLIDSPFSIEGLLLSDYLAPDSQPKTTQLPKWAWWLAGLLFLLVTVAWWSSFRIWQKQRRALHAELQHLAHALKVKNKFLSIIAHDLRGPMSAVATMSQLLEKEMEEYLPKEQQELMKLFSQNLGHAESLLDNLLSWARNQKETLQPHPVMVNVNELVQQTLHLLRPMAQQKHIGIRAQIDDLLLLNTDRDMLLFILRNLLSNAIKFSWPESEILVTVRTIAGRQVEFAVADNGMGIPPEQQRLLFQAENPITTKGTQNEKGTGLGLVLVKEFIDKNRGHIYVESQVGHGSKFVFVLPIQ